MKEHFITAQIIADSLNKNGKRITTFELVYPRIILAELNTHRVFSRNSASSRAIPINTINKMILENPARPVFWGKNEPGMQSYEEYSALIQGYTPDQWWDLAAKSAVRFSQEFADAGYHKQIGNRLTEAFVYMKTVVTATSYDNWFHLRNHEAADPTIHVLANTMLQAYKESLPKVLLPGEWHTPYYQDGYWSELDGGKDVHGNSLQDALDISASCCAQVSYRKLDDTLEKARSINAKLIPQNAEDPCHASPYEHQGTPMEIPVFTKELFLECGADYSWETGVTHMKCNGEFCSGNFEQWVQHRQLIPYHDCKVYSFE